MIDDNGNAAANDPEDLIASRNFFIGPGIARAGNGPLAGRTPPEKVIDDPSVNEATFTAENVSSTSTVADVIGTVSVPGTQAKLGSFSLSPIATNKGGPLFNLGDFTGTFDGFSGAGDYDIAIYAVDDRGNTSRPQVSRLRKIAGADIFEVDDVPNASNAIITDGAAQRHTLHTPEDEDWLRFSLSDSPARVLEFRLSDIDPGLTIRLTLFDDSRLTDGNAPAVLSQTLVGGGSITKTVSIPDSTTAPAGRYFVQISRESFIAADDSDPSPGYSIALNSPFGFEGVKLTGRIVDAATMQPISGATILPFTEDAGICGPAGRCTSNPAFTCSPPICGERGVFTTFLNQGVYDVQIDAPGYETVVLASIALDTPGGTITLQPDPVELVSQGASAPSADNVFANSLSESVIQLTGTINANGTETNGTFIATPFAGQPTEISPTFLVVGNRPTPVGTNAGGLRCETMYRFVLQAENAGGRVESTEFSVETGTCPTTGPDLVFLNGFE